jgi:hypothetical protein
MGDFYQTPAEYERVVGNRAYLGANVPLSTGLLAPTTFVNTRKNGLPG